jgi:amidase
MARNVADAAAVLSVIAGYDPDDPATATLRRRPAVDYTGFLNADSLQGARIGVLRQFAGFHEEVDAEFERALIALRALGAILVDPANIANADKLDSAKSTVLSLDADENTVLSYEFKDGLNRYLPTRIGPGPKSLAEVIAFNDQHATAEMPFFRQELFLQAQARADLSDPKYIEAHQRAKRLAGAEGIDATLAKDHLDALVAPTLGPAWTTDIVNGDHFLGGGVSTPTAVAGYPHITVPMGMVHGLPVGLSFVASAWSEGKLIGYAYAFEQATHARIRPTFSASLPRGSK